MIVNSRETAEGDKVTYVDQAGKIYEATITSLAEQDGNAYAEVEFDDDGEPTRVTWVPHNTALEKNSWNHSLV